MLSFIEEYLRKHISEERTQLFMDVLRVMYSYQIASPAQSIIDLISLEDTYTPADELIMIETLLNDAINEVLNSFQIITNGTVEQNLNLLKAIHQLEGFFDSDVIVNLHNDFEEAKEMLLIYLPLVTNVPIEYFDEFIIDVRYGLIERLYDHHLEIVEADIEDITPSISKDKIAKIKTFGQTYPNALGIKLVTSGLLTLNASLKIALNFLQDEILEKTDEKQIALDIYSVALVCNDNDSATVKVAMDIVNRFYDDIHLTSTLKNIINSIEIGSNK